MDRLISTTRIDRPVDLYQENRWRLIKLQALDLSRNRELRLLEIPSPLLALTGLSYTMYELNGFGKSTSSQNHQLVVYYYGLIYRLLLLIKTIG